jgi:hypothetical protein
VSWEAATVAQAEDFRFPEFAQALIEHDSDD